LFRHVKHEVGRKPLQVSFDRLNKNFGRHSVERRQVRVELEKAGASPRRGNSRIDDPKAYMAEGVLPRNYQIINGTLLNYSRRNPRFCSSTCTRRTWERIEAHATTGAKAHDPVQTK